MHAKPTPNFSMSRQWQPASFLKTAHFILLLHLVNTNIPPSQSLFFLHSMAECKGSEAVTWTDTILSDRFNHDALQPQLQLMLMCQQQISQPVACVQNG